MGCACIVADVVSSPQVCRCTSSVLTQSRVDASERLPGSLYSVRHTIPPLSGIVNRQNSAPPTFHHNPPFPLKSPPPVGFALTTARAVERRSAFCLKLYPTLRTRHQRPGVWVRNVPGRRPTFGRAEFGRAHGLIFIPALWTDCHALPPPPKTCAHNCITHSLHHTPACVQTCTNLYKKPSPTARPECPNLYSRGPKTWTNSHFVQIYAPVFVYID